MDNKVAVQEILGQLQQVQQLRDSRRGNAGIESAVLAIKAYQHARFEHTYADLLASPRHGRAARFFLDDLYGPADHSLRDAQFAKVVPAIARLFPQRVIATVLQLSQLHCLSEELDHDMGRVTATLGPLDLASYRRAWQSVGRRDSRERQLTLALALGAELDQLTRSVLLRKGLHLMRPAAHAAGLGALQAFLEAGFDAFAAMDGANAFLDTIACRERKLFALLFDDMPDTDRLLG